MNTAEQKEAFLQGMKSKQDQRAGEVGGHGWPDYVARYGVQALFAEIASILGRVEKMLWPIPQEDLDHQRLQDLCVDGGNYFNFLYDWSKKQEEQPESSFSVEMPKEFQ